MGAAGIAPHPDLVQSPFPRTEPRFDSSGELADVGLTMPREAWDALSAPAAGGVVDAVLAEPQRNALPVLHQVSAVMCAAGRPADGAFWFYAPLLCPASSELEVGEFGLRGRRSGPCGPP